jgi:hypothetical protein
MSVEEVSVTRIDPAPGDIELEDARTKTPVWRVPVIYQLAGGYEVETYRRMVGEKADAEAWAASLPIEPKFPMRARFVKGELEAVITKMVPV